MQPNSFAAAFQAAEPIDLFGRINLLQASLIADEALEIPTAYAASGTINAVGIGLLTKAGVAVMTLAAPVAGATSAGGQDGLFIQLIDTTGNAHTVTTPANAINGSKHIATFGGTIGSALTLRAFNGVWYATGSGGVTLS